MKLIKDNYIVTRETMEKVLMALGNNWFRDDGEDEDNNDDVIEADGLLKDEIRNQHGDDNG